ncbi:MAG: hypothetical protein IK082_05050 [Oscillospiraceae bacterium]|nr:hypothetical protein [Oscillospiraceae bacterium]
MTLTNGFEVTVDENALHDWDVVETICEIDNGNSTKLPALFNAILGEKQKKALVAYQREKTGACTVEDMSGFLVEIFNALKTDEKK